MREDFAAVLSRWGQTVERTGAGQETERWKAFVQPVLRSQREEERASTPLGDVDERQWLYAGPADIPLERGETLLQGGLAFRVREWTMVFAGEAPLYCRAVLVREKEAVL